VLVGLAVLGQDARPVTGTTPAVSASAPPRAGLFGVALIPMLTPIPFAGVAVTPRPVPAGHRREEGTDGMMGRLPFGLDGDTPLVRLGGPGHVNRFTIDDVRTSWSTLDTTPPWVRRLGVLGSQATDPYQR
jgi:hypothetical protein